MINLFDPIRQLLLDIVSPIKSQEQLISIKQRLKNTKPDNLLKLSSIEFLSPLLYYQMRSLNIPEYNKILQPLKDSYMRNTARNILLLKQIKLLKKQAEKEGIHFILLKGAGLAISIYNEVGLRPMADVDILIQKQHIQKIKSLMEQNNMHPLFKDTNQNWLFKIKSHIMPYQSEDNAMSLEAHTRLFDDRFIHFQDINPFDNARTVNWDNETFFILDPYTAFIYGLYHIVVHHNFSFRLRDICDLKYIVSFYKLNKKQLLAYIDTTHATELFLPLINIAFEDVKDASLTYVYLYWTNSVVMKYIPIQLSSRLTEVTLRIATALTSGLKNWFSGIFRFTNYEVSIFYKSPKRGGIFKRAGMALWLISIAIVYAIVLPLFYIKVKIQNRS